MIRAQLLTAERPADLLDMVRRLTLVQLDATNAVAPSADLVAFSRLGPSYQPDQLDAALARRELLDLRSMIRPADDLALYLADMRRWADGTTLVGWRRSFRDWMAANAVCRRDILTHLAASGPLPAKDIPDSCVVPWKSSGWNHQRNVGQMLDVMERCGEVAVSGRQGWQRLWDLADRVYPEVDAVPADEAERERNRRRLRSLGLARAKAAETQVEPGHVADAGESAAVEGVRGTWRVDPELLAQVRDEPFDGRTALLSPFDRLVFDRKRADEVFDFDYALEMYKPVDQRMWGYYALPYLCGDGLIGKADLTADREAGVLRVNRLHRDVEFDDAADAGLHAEIDTLAAWLGLTVDG
ncbi:MAG: YcaQ family DNA glycosylase [Acidimicrobiaceae bacterium]|nr:YcaQ family DNA glycosylase [Acidimicrobiaceae bacterium]